MMRRKRFIAGVAAEAMLAGRRSARAQFAPFARQLTLAVSVPLSGSLADYGNQILAGVRGAIDETNRFSPSPEIVFGMRPFDDRNRPEIAIANAQIAAADPTVIALIGGLTLDPTLAILPACANASLPLIVPTITRDDLTARGYHCVFRLATPDAAAGRLAAQRIGLDVRPRATAVVARDRGYGYDYARSYAAQTRADKRRADEMLLPPGPPDAAGIARTILAAKNDFVFIAGTSADLGSLLPALHAAGYAGGIGASDGFYDEETIRTYGPLLADAWIATSMPPLERAAGIALQLADLRREVGTVGTLTVFAYAAAQVAIQAARRLNATSRMTELRALQESGGFQTLVGTLSFGFDGNPLDPNLYFYRVEKDRFVYRTAAHPTSFVL